MADKAMKVTYGDYVIESDEKGSISVLKSGTACDNAKGALREIAQLINFEVDPDWTSRQFGSKLMKFISESAPRQNFNEQTTANKIVQTSAAKLEINNEKSQEQINTYLDEIKELESAALKGDSVAKNKLLNKDNIEDPVAQYYIADFFYNLHGTDNTQIAFDRWNKLAQNGYLPAAYPLSQCYHDGHGTDVNLGLAVRWAAAYASYEQDGKPIIEYYKRSEFDKGHGKKRLIQYIKEIQTCYNYVTSILTTFFDLGHKHEEGDNLGLWNEVSDNQWPAKYFNADKLRLLIDNYFENLKQLAEAKKEEDYWYDQHNEMEKKYNERVQVVEEKNARIKELEEQLKAKEERIQKLLERNSDLLASGASSSSSCDKMVNVRVSVSTGGWFPKSNTFKMTQSEYKALLNGPAKNRISFAKAHCIELLIANPNVIKEVTVELE